MTLQDHLGWLAEFEQSLPPNVKDQFSEAFRALTGELDARGNRAGMAESAIIVLLEFLGEIEVKYEITIDSFDRARMQATVAGVMEALKQNMN